MATEAKKRIDLKSLNSIKDVPKEEILDRSANGKTLVLLDGTKVSDELIQRAKTEAKAHAAATEAAEKSGIDLDDPEAIKKIHAIATDAAEAVFAKHRANEKK